jgi:hypothetical protein
MVMESSQSASRRGHMIKSQNHFEDLVHATAERFLYDTQALINQYGPEEGQQIAEKVLTALAKTALDADPKEQPLNNSERQAVAYAVKLALATLKSDRGAAN